GRPARAGGPPRRPPHHAAAGGRAAGGDERRRAAPEGKPDALMTRQRSRHGADDVNSRNADPVIPTTTSTRNPTMTSLRIVPWLILALSAAHAAPAAPARTSSKGARPVTHDRKLETATLAGGCFWCLDAVFSELRGVEKVQSGFAGGTVPNPSYEQVCT